MTTPSVARFKKLYGFTNYAVLRASALGVGRDSWAHNESEHLHASATKAWWDAYNLWEERGARKDDIPKPTWEEAVAHWRALSIRYIVDGTYTGRVATEAHAARTTRPFAAPEHSASPLHVGDGPDRFTGVSHALHRATLAGTHYRPLIFRDQEDRLVHMWTGQAAGGFTDSLVDDRELTESAHSVLLARYAADAAALAALDLETEADDVDAARDKLVARMGRAAGELEEIVAEISADDYLPSDLTTLKAMHLERLEAAAMRRVKAIKGVVSQQGVDLPPSCLDEANALEAVARAQRLGSFAIRGAADAAAARAAWDAAVAVIEAVTPLNVPELFDADGNTVAADIAVEQSAPVKLIARHPAGEDIPGVVSVSVGVEAYVAGAFVAQADKLDQDGKFEEVAVTLSPPEETGETVEYRVEARNLCGPARALTVNITRPEAVVQPV